MASLLKSEEKLKSAKILRRRNYKLLPLRHIYIPEAGSKKKLCPILISTYHPSAISLHACSPGEQITCHRLAEKNRRERYIGDYKKYPKKPGLAIADVIGRLENFSPEISTYIQQIKRHKPTLWQHHLRSLLALRANYRVVDILVAGRRTCKYKVFESGAIERFLENNSEPRYSIKLSFKPNSM